jgi:hypothetical protein
MVVDSSRAGLSMGSEFHETVRTGDMCESNEQSAKNDDIASLFGLMRWVQCEQISQLATRVVAEARCQLEQRNLSHFVVLLFDFASGFSRSLLPPSCFAHQRACNLALAALILDVPSAPRMVPESFAGCMDKWFCL